MTPRTSGKPRNNARKEAARNLQRLNPGMSYKQAFRQAGPDRGALAPHQPHLSTLLCAQSSSKLIPSCLPTAVICWRAWDTAVGVLL